MNTNCQPCNTTPTVPVSSPPTCPTTACDEYVSTDCIVSSISGGCASEFYQYDPSTGGLVTDTNGNPLSQNPVVPLGYQFDAQDSMTSILSAMSAIQNCMFNPNYIAGMLQVIQANPTHPVAQIFCNLACNCSCDSTCPLSVVETIAMDPTYVTDTGFQIAFTGVKDYLYLIEISDSNAITPTVYHYSYTIPPVTATPTGTVIFNTNQLLDSNNNPVPILPSGHSFEITITSMLGIASCTSSSFTGYTIESSTCDCHGTVVLSLSNESTTIGMIDLSIVATSPVIIPNGYLPQYYNIELIDLTNNVTIFGPADFDPTSFLNPPPANKVTISFGGTSGNGVLAGGDYQINVIPVCISDPYSRCIGDTFTLTTTVDAPTSCVAPDITNISISVTP
jgi:hypothetical protein